MEHNENQSKIIRNRVNLLEGVDRMKYYEFYGYASLLNGKSEDHFPLDDDWDKKWDVEIYILDNLKHTNENLFKGLIEYLVDLDLISTEISEQYFVHNNRIAKYC